MNKKCLLASFFLLFSCYSTADDIDIYITEPGVTTQPYVMLMIDYASNVFNSAGSMPSIASGLSRRVYTIMCVNKQRGGELPCACEWDDTTGATPPAECSGVTRP